MTTRTRSARAHHAATLASLERSLRDRRDQLSRRVGMIEADLRSGHDRDSQEHAGELENDEVLTQLDEMSLAELHQIREALQRIRNGTYGTCSGCGQPIVVERLSAVPTAATCVACTPARRR